MRKIDSDKIICFLFKYRDLRVNPPIAEVIADIHDVIISVPFMVAPLSPGVRLERVRNNYNGEIFNKVEEMSFRPDVVNIKEYGRANLIHQSVFYGCMFPQNIEFARLTNVIETNPILRSGNKNHKGNNIFTTGQWEVKGLINLLILPLNEKAILNNYITRVEFEHYMKELNRLSSETRELVFELVKFFANEFAKPVINHIDYKLTAAFSYVFMVEYGIDGVVYPSVKAEYRSHNIAMTPAATLSLELLKVGMYELLIDGTQVHFNPLAYAIDLGKGKRAFLWIPAEKERLKDFLMMT
jgi:hypothetical protein